MSTSPIWFQEILESIVIPNWKIFAFISTYGELVIGTSLILGFLLRPVMIFAIIMLTVSTYATGTPEVNFFQVKFAVLLTMFAMGGGRCLGLDYHFFKSRRGFWW
jgi:thiosulfate dehydrogenase [quinone] large subunit